jgi:hypothetical protein
MDRPVISQRKYDETAYVNARTYWSLALSRGDATFELRVRHSGTGDSTRFYRLDADASKELVSAEEYRVRCLDIIEHEGHGPCEREGCQNPEGAEYRLASGRRVCLPCAQLHNMQDVTALTDDDAERRAHQLLADRVRLMDGHEAAVEAHLRRTWEAFALLFTPAITL